MTPSAAEELRRAVEDASGWDLTGARGDLFRGALARAAAAARSTPEEHAASLLAGGREAIGAFVADAAVGETYFFRDTQQWDLVETVVVPAAIARRRTRDRTLFAAWSAGCSTGEEPYTLAMLLAERGLVERARIAATDLAPAALARARAAEYTHWSLRGGMDPRARRWLRDDGGTLRVARDVAGAVTFFELNLASGAYPDAARGLAALDLVLCRNVLLYLRPDAVAEVASRLFAALAPGGWLLTSASDPPLRRFAPFAVHSGPFGVAYQRPPPGAAKGEVPVVAPPAESRRPTPRERAAAAPRAKGGPRERSGAHAAPPDACPGCRALMDAGRLAEALALVDASLRRDPLAPEVHLLRAIVMADLGDLREAEAACRRALFLARGEPFLHFFLATVLERAGDAAGAAAALRNAAAVADRLAPDEAIPWSEGIAAAELAASARWQLRRLEAGVQPRP